MDKVVDTECIISFISEIELQVWNPPNPDDVPFYHAFVAGSVVIGIAPEIIRETVRIRKIFKLKLPDALIAITAIDKDYTLIADNDADFKKVPGLKYINPALLH